jgi:hypothetical protein
LDFTSQPEMTLDSESDFAALWKALNLMLSRIVHAK